jgi:hypothetical protein
VLGSRGRTVTQADSSGSGGSPISDQPLLSNAKSGRTFGEAVSGDLHDRSLLRRSLTQPEPAASAGSSCTVGGRRGRCTGEEPNTEPKEREEENTLVNLSRDAQLQQLISIWERYRAQVAPRRKAAATSLVGVCVRLFVCCWCV